MEAVAPDRQLAGRYTLVEQIGAGGMATVWRADDSVLARTVAVKVLRDHLAADAALLERFRKEAVGAARLAHPNIVRVYDAGTDDGHAFIVMEYVPGRTLRDVIEREGPLDVSPSAGVTSGVLSALACAHAAGVIHRDIRPGNILIAHSGLVKVTDFGLAAAGGGDLEATGEILGTVEYVAPEQVQGGDVTPATDLYATGLVLYELLTGRPAFRGPTDLATAMARLTTTMAPPSAIRPGIPRGMDHVVERATAIRPEDRYPSADGMRAALEGFTGAPDRPPLPPSRPTGPPDPAPPAGRSALRAWMLVPLVVILVTAAVIAGGLALGRLSLGGPLGIQAASPVPSTSARAATLALVPLAGARSEDPQGPDGSEHPDTVGLAIDGNPGTSWTTDHYQSATFGNLKTGLGLWVEFGSSAEVHTVTITSSLPGWTFQLFATPEASGTALASANGATTFTATEGTTAIALRPHRAPGVLIWITGLAPDHGKFAASIADVAVRGAV
jgi:serine/threonine-protein kinase